MWFFVGLMVGGVLGMMQMDDAPLGFTETEINDDELPF